MNVAVSRREFLMKAGAGAVTGAVLTAAGSGRPAAAQSVAARSAVARPADAGAGDARAGDPKATEGMDPKARRVVDPKAPAAAAGTFWIGGDLEVSRLGFGAMRVTGDGIWGEPPDVQVAYAVLRRAVALGSNLIDTADAYGPNVSERLIREALYPYPRGLLIATKGGQVRPSREQWVPDGRPEHLREACEASLGRLKLERIDLYQLHRPDPKVPYEDSVGELARLQKEGKIRHVGVSNVDVQQLAKARAIVKVVSVQNRYNVADRASDDVLAVCEREKIAFLPWGPLAQRAQASATPDPHLAALEAIARERNIDINQAALAWLLARSPVMLPIPGTSKVEHLEDNVGAAKIKLTSAEMERVG
ncbi:MAG TPA: aldo/keto reductase [Steroidobacteraceae bacterium]|nr:aldo/keto reductase [Steroidobacteraceae bacterium]